MKSEKKKLTGKQKTVKVYIPLILVVVFVLVGGGYWYNNYSKYITSDDAHVEGNSVSLSSKILGRIVSINSEEGDTVRKGVLLVIIDSTDLVAQRNQLKASKEQTVAQKLQSEAKYQYDLESLEVLKINTERAKDDFDRAKQQFDGGVITKEQFEHIQKTYESAKAQYKAANSQLLVSKAQIGSAESTVHNAEAQINVKETEINNTKLYAPMDAVIAKKWMMPGDLAQPGQTILSLNTNSGQWISVYLEETKLSNIYIGQKAEFTIDSYHGVTFTGHVFYIGGNTASQFSLIPPNNASGNFTKITQRVLIKLAIDGTDKNITPDAYKFMPGVSAVVKIIKK
jgi:membrane fusion protein (multidrug efflux system)